MPLKLNNMSQWSYGVKPKAKHPQKQEPRKLNNMSQWSWDEVQSTTPFKQEPRKLKIMPLKLIKYEPMELGGEFGNGPH